MKGIVMFGAVLALLGLIAFAMPSFNTEETKDVVKLGDLKVQAGPRSRISSRPSLVAEQSCLVFC